MANSFSKVVVWLWAPPWTHCLLISFFLTMKPFGLDNCPENFKPLFYWQYVDDCFLLFRSPDHILPFLNSVNLKHPNIQFTHNLETSNTLSFLGICITCSNGSTNSIFHKPTFTGLFTNFEFYSPRLQKGSYIFTPIPILQPLFFLRNLSFCNNQTEIIFKKEWLSREIPRQDH